MQSLKKISLKTRLFFLIGISVISFSGIMLPYLFQLKNKCNLYKIVAIFAKIYSLFLREPVFR